MNNFNNDMKKINTGRININNEYEKIVSFSKAVLWMTHELSIPQQILKSLVCNKVEVMNYIDKKKKEKWIFLTRDVNIEGRIKQLGKKPRFIFRFICRLKKN